MYSSYPSYILGFHGCDLSIAERVICGEKVLNPSANDYDWLGHGIYFWENDPERALQFAKEAARRTSQKNSHPAVIGAVVDLGACLNLVESKNLQLLKVGYETLQVAGKTSQISLPKNKSGGLLRHLDCAVIETVHNSREEEDLRPFDTVRGVFWEGRELYPNAGFKEKNHIQICVRNPNCIKGFFRIQTQNRTYSIP